MYHARFSMMLDFAIIIDILKLKNVHNGVALHMNSERLAISTYKNIFHETDIRFSTINCKNSDNDNSSIFIQNYYQKVGIILNTSSADWEEAFNLMNAAKAFKRPFIWLIVTEDLKETTKVLSKYPIEVDSDVTLIYKKNSKVLLYEIFNTGFVLNGVMIVRQIGSWNRTLQIVRKDRLDLNGLVLRCTLVLLKGQKVAHETFVQYLEREQPTLTTIDPLHKSKYYEILKYYQEMFNISFTFQRSYSWGYLTNGSFDGMVGALQRFEADIAGSPLFLRTERMAAIEYAAETWKTRPCFIFRHPKHSGGYSTIYTRPLSNDVWYCILGFLVLASTILGLMLRSGASGGEDETTSTAILFIWGAVCQQGLTINRNSASVKIVVMFTFIFTVTLYQYYNAIVVSTLLWDPPKNIRTMEDLLKSNLKAGVEDVLYNKDFFKTSTDPLVIEMYKKRIIANGQYNFFPLEEGMRLVKRGGFAFHVDRALAYRIMKGTFSEPELCEATEVSVNVPQNTGAAVSKGSPYKEHIAYGIRKLNENGIMRRIQTIWDESRPGCVRRPDSSLISVSLREFSTAIMVLAVGFIAATVVLMIELLHWECTAQVIEFRH